MNIKKLRERIAMEYTVSEGDAVIPKFATQFFFSKEKILILIPSYEVPTMPGPLLRLIVDVISETAPSFSGGPHEVTNLLAAASSGQTGKNGSVQWRGQVETTSTDSRGAVARAITACVFEISLDDQARR